jgi:His/Glu/Gln/Arg/opine family amino acid ABC transporter permease subunit
MLAPIALLYTGPLLHGLVTTLLLFAAAGAASSVLGVAFAVMLDLEHPVVSRLARVYSSVLRGLPPLLLLLFVFLGFPTIGLTLPPFLTALVGITLYGLAYMGEIIRAGLKSAGRDMRDAARALGIPYRLALARIYLPHASRVAAPAFFTQATELLKDTALAGAVGVTELALAAQAGASVTLKPLTVFAEAAVGYAAIGSVLLLVQERTARRARRPTISRRRRSAWATGIGALRALLVRSGPMVPARGRRRA